MLSEARVASEPANAKPAVPFLEHFPELDQPPHWIRLTPMPFEIGRDTAANYVIHSQRVSKAHARICGSGDGFVILDCNSTNGTFVNGRRINEARLQANDI